MIMFPRTRGRIVEENGKDLFEIDRLEYGPTKKRISIIFEKRISRWQLVDTFAALSKTNLRLKSLFRTIFERV